MEKTPEMMTMSSKDSLEDKEQEMEKTPELKTEELSQKNDWFVLLKKKVYWRQPIALLAGCAAMIVVGTLINYAWIIPVIVEQKQSIAYVQSKLSAEAELNDETLHDKIFEEFIRLKEILNNTMTQFSELKDRLEADNLQYQATISELKDRDVKLRARVSQLEEEDVQQKAKIIELEETDRRQKDKIMQLEATNEQHQVNISKLQLQVVQLEGEASELRANQFELSNHTAELNESKVDNDEFNDLVDTVSELAITKADRSTVMKLEEELTNLTETAFNHTLEGDIERIDATLATKADQQDVNKITDTITTLQETTVKREQFQQLVTTVGHKADKSDLNDLENTVNHLRQTMATKSELNSLSGRLSSSISGNDRDIQNLQSRVGTVEGDIEELKSAASRPLASWLIIAMAIIIVLINPVSLL